MARTIASMATGYGIPSTVCAWNTRDSPWNASLPDARCYRLTGPTMPDFPADGGDIDGVHVISQRTDGPLIYWLIPALPGATVQVECAASVSYGALLETDGTGRVKPQGTGKAVLRALESGGAGALVWCTFTSGR